MADTLINVAVIGCGRMGRLHTQRILDDGRARVVALYDTNPETARQLQHSFIPNARICPSFHDLLNQPDISAAIICTPTTSHYDQFLACLNQQWHILCEKPLAESRQRTVEMIAAGERGNSLCMLAYQRRFSATYRTLRHEVQSGKWGRIRGITSHNIEKWEQTIAGTWRDDPTINIGGFVGDAGSHKLDLLHYVTGLTVRDVQAHSDLQNSRVPILTTVRGTMSNGAMLAMDFIGNGHYLGEDFHVHCEHADLMVRDRSVWIARDNRIEPLTNLEPELNPVQGFLNLITESGENLAPLAGALPVWDLLAAIMASSASQHRVNIGHA